MKRKGLAGIEVLYLLVLLTGMILILSHLALYNPFRVQKVLGTIETASLSKNLVEHLKGATAIGWSKFILSNVDKNLTGANGQLKNLDQIETDAEQLISSAPISGLAGSLIFDSSISQSDVEIEQSEIKASISSAMNIRFGSTRMDNVPIQNEITISSNLGKLISVSAETSLIPFYIQSLNIQALEFSRGESLQKILEFVKATKQNVQDVIVNYDLKPTYLVTKSNNIDSLVMNYELNSMLSEGVYDIYSIAMTEQEIKAVLEKNGFSGAELDSLASVINDIEDPAAGGTGLPAVFVLAALAIETNWGKESCKEPISNNLFNLACSPKPCCTKDVKDYQIYQSKEISLRAFASLVSILVEKHKDPFIIANKYADAIFSDEEQAKIWKQKMKDTIRLILKSKQPLTRYISANDCKQENAGALFCGQQPNRVEFKQCTYTRNTGWKLQSVISFIDCSTCDDCKNLYVKKLIYDIEDYLQFKNAKLVSDFDDPRIERNPGDSSSAKHFGYNIIFDPLTAPTGDYDYLFVQIGSTIIPSLYQTYCNGLGSQLGLKLFPVVAAFDGKIISPTTAPPGQAQLPIAEDWEGGSAVWAQSIDGSFIVSYGNLKNPLIDLPTGQAVIAVSGTTPVGTATTFAGSELGVGDYVWSQRTLIGCTDNLDVKIFRTGSPDNYWESATRWTSNSLITQISSANYWRYFEDLNQVDNLSFSIETKTEGSKSIFDCTSESRFSFYSKDDMLCLPNTLFTCNFELTGATKISEGGVLNPAYKCISTRLNEDKLKDGNMINKFCRLSTSPGVIPDSALDKACCTSPANWIDVTYTYVSGSQTRTISSGSYCDGDGFCCTTPECPRDESSLPPPSPGNPPKKSSDCP